ncbi:MAG: Fic family protein [Actinomycetota bacterium]|nr:Fic family protein [Actinomycetota bacterium]
MTIKEKALHWWAGTIKDGKNVVSGAEIPDQRQRAFLFKQKFIYGVARGYWLLNRPEDDIDEVFPLVYWEIIDAVLARYTWSVSGLPAAVILNGGQGAQKELIVGTKEKTNWKLPLIDDFSISIRYEPHFDERFIKQTKVANREIPVDIPEKVFIDINKLDLPETRNFIAGTDFDLRKLEALYSKNPKPIVFKRLIDMSKNTGRLDLVTGLERIMDTYTHYSVGRKEKVNVVVAAKKPAILKPPWVLRQEQQINKFEEVLEKKFEPEIRSLKKYPLHKLLKQAKEHKKYDTYHSTSLEGYQITPEEVNALLSGEIPKDVQGQGDAYLEKIKNRMAILGYSGAFDFILEEAQTNFKHPAVSQKLIKDAYYQLFKPSVDAEIVDSWMLVDYRNVPVFIRGASYVPPSYEKLPELMASFEAIINKIENPVIKAILAHYLFVTIHPYIDGNGRTARLLMNYLLVVSGYPWITTRADQRFEYFKGLNVANLEDDIIPFGKFIVGMLKSVG